MRCFLGIYVVFLLFSSLSFGQIKNTEIGFITDNDLYTSSKNDMYYTNGLTFYYRYLGKSVAANTVKITNEISLGQYVFTPRFLNIEAIDINDRPFAGYLFAGFEKGYFYKNESVLKATAEIGTVGSNSFAEEFQKNFHKAFNYKKVYGWENQIQNTLGLQTHVLFSKKIFTKATQKTIDFSWQSEADLGTVFTGISTGFMSRIGFKNLVALFDSNFYGASVGTDTYRVSEFYFYIAPSIRYQIYDATIQGSIWNDSSPLTFNLKPIRFNGEAGFKYRKNNLNVSYSFVYRGKEIENSPSTGYFYGSISVSYLFL